MKNTIVRASIIACVMLSGPGLIYAADRVEPPKQAPAAVRNEPHVASKAVDDARPGVVHELEEVVITG
jgi:hypothetical protein